MRVTPGQTSQSVDLEILKDTGKRNTTAVYNTSGLAARYSRDNGTAVAITLVTLASESAAWTSGGFIKRSNGLFRLDIPNAAVAAGASRVAITIDETTDINGVAFLIEIDEAISTRLAPATAGRTLLVDSSGRVDISAIGGNASAASGLGSMGQQYSDFTYIPTSVTKWGGTNVTGMPMPTYTQPTGFLAATFPTTVSSFAGGAVASVTGNVGGSVASVTGAVGAVAGNVGGSIAGSVNSVVTGVTVTTNNDKTGYTLSQGFPTNFASMAITAGGAVTAGTVSDKTGYSLTVTPPTAAAISTLVNSDLTTAHGSGSYLASAVTAASIGGVTVATNGDKTGYSLTQGFPTNFSSLGINASGHVSRVTLVDTTTTLTNTPSIPTAAQNASAVRTELTTELGRIDVATSTRMATFTYTVPPTAAANATAVRTELTTELGRIDAAISTRSTYSGTSQTGDAYAYVVTNLGAAGAGATALAPASTALSTGTWTNAKAAFLNASIAAIPTTPLLAGSYTAPDNAGIAAIKAKTDNLPATPASTSDIPSAATNATAVRTNLATELARIDVAVSSVGGGGGTIDTAAIAAATAALLSGQTLTYVGPVNPATGEVLIYAGDAYEGDRALRWTITNYTGTVVDGDAVDLRFLSIGRYRSERQVNTADTEFEGVAALASGTLTITVELTAGVTANFDAVYPVDEAPTHQAMVIKGGETIVDAAATVTRRIRPKP